MEKVKLFDKEKVERKKISVEKAKKLFWACYKEETTEDIVYDQPYYRYVALRIAKEISIDAYGNDGHTNAFYNLFSALLEFQSCLYEPSEVLKSLGFELVD